MKKFFVSFILVIVFIPCLPAPVAAQGNQIALSITPPLTKNNANPGQVWQSMIKVMNNNTNDIDIYIQISDFRGGKESGTIEFIDKPQATAGTSSQFLSDWIKMDQGPIRIPAAQSVDIPFFVEVPADASPGGHYAAFLVGNKPSQDSPSGSVIKISSLLASLLFLTVSGDLDEQARIVDFSTDKTFYFEPKVDFKIRMENSGNVDVQPRGEIKIYDLFNKEKASIPINHNSEFGNILPDSFREWNFSWEKDKSILDMGRYKAHLVLTYGNQNIQTEDYVYFFWIVYPKIVGGILLFILIIFLLISFWIKRSIRKAVNETKQAAGLGAEAPSMIAGQYVGGHVLDLSAGTDATEQSPHLKKFGWSALKTFFIFILIFLLAAAGVFYYLAGKGEKLKLNIDGLSQLQSGTDKVSEVNEDNANNQPKEDRIEIEKTETIATTTPESAANGSVGSSSPPAKLETAPKLTVAVLNGCGKRGVAAQVDQFLSQKGYEISRLGNADNFNYYNTVIKYTSGYAAEAEKISKLFKKPAEVQETSAQPDSITVIIGSDLEL